jgi:hypothetical protein
MTDLVTAQALEAAREHAIKAWYLFTGNRGLKARIPDWRTSTAPDGSPVLSVEVAGPGAAHALNLFASQYYLILGHPGDLRPQFDITVPGRTVLVWRHTGVWVELWHPDTLPATPEPVQPAPEADTALISAATHRPLLGPGGRLTFTRRSKKETTTA